MVIQDYFKDLTNHQISQFERLENLYKDWNSQINVISRKDMDHFFIRHVLHSTAIAKIVQFDPNSSVLDVGTGGGFPGIPLAILPEVKFHLVDSTGKKIKVVKSVANEISLSNVAADHIRVEDLSGKYDYIVSRAVKRLEPFYQWIQNKFKKGNVNNGGLYALKGGDLSEEIMEFTEAFPNPSVETKSISDFYSDEFFATKKILTVKNNS